MAGVPVRLRLGPDSYEVSAAVTGGQLVVPTTGGKVGPAGADALTVLGVALNDALPTGSDVNTTFSTARNYTAVAYGPAELNVTYAAAATFGAKLKAAASGQVTPITADGDPRLIVGICTEPAGVGSGLVGRMRISV
jgi:hypothetical protein